MLNKILSVENPFYLLAIESFVSFLASINVIYHMNGKKAHWINGKK
jgi:hypothetical protein